MPVYEVIWQDRADGTEFDDEYDEPSLSQAAILAQAGLPPDMVLVSVREAGYAQKEKEHELA